MDIIYGFCLTTPAMCNFVQKDPEPSMQVNYIYSVWDSLISTTQKCSQETEKIFALLPLIIPIPERAGSATKDTLTSVLCGFRRDSTIGWSIMTNPLQRRSWSIRRGRSVRAEEWTAVASQKSEKRFSLWLLSIPITERSGSATQYTQWISMINKFLLAFTKTKLKLKPKTKTKINTNHLHRFELKSGHNGRRFCCAILFVNLNITY